MQQLRGAGDGHDARHDGNVYAEFVGVVDKAEVSVTVVKILAVMAECAPAFTLVAKACKSAFG